MYKKTMIFILIFVIIFSVSNLSYCKEDAYLKGYRAYNEKDYGRAIENFKMAIIDNPENFMAYWCFYFGSHLHY
jgi:hypothetical protein